MFAVCSKSGTGEVVWLDGSRELDDAGTLGSANLVARVLQSLCHAECGATKIVGLMGGAA